MRTFARHRPGRDRGAATLGAALVLVALSVAEARPACPPPDLLLEGVRTAHRAQIEQLGSEATRIESPFAHVPGRTLGYEVQGFYRLSAPVVDALGTAFGRRDSYDCGAVPDSSLVTPGPLAVGMMFSSGRGAIVVVLHLPEGRVDLQLEGGTLATAPLSAAGKRRWNAALALLTGETHSDPREFYRQMLPPPAAPAPAPPADSADTSRDGVQAPR